jgi:hypothetical protein
MIDILNTNFERFIKLEELFNKVSFDLPQSTTYKYKQIEKKANVFLKYCQENITIRIDSIEDYVVKITDKSRKLKDEKDVKKYFNEAKLNLVIFALLFSTIEVYKKIGRKNILILDDFITSLDMSNRTFLMKYILDTFEDFQILIFTHNVYFYNLIIFLINDIYGRAIKWQYANLYEIRNNHRLHITESIKKRKSELEKLEKDWINTKDGKDIGNKIRQRFEILLYEFSKILMIGGVEESNKILEAVINNRLYLKDENNACCELSSEIEEEIDSLKKKKKLIDDSSCPDKDGAKTIKANETLNNIATLLESYKLEDLQQIKDIMKNLKLYRKVSMHPLSHGKLGKSNFSDKEIDSSIKLLKKLEKNIFDLTPVKFDGA